MSLALKTSYRRVENTDVDRFYADEITGGLMADNGNFYLKRIGRWGSIDQNPNLLNGQNSMYKTTLSYTLQIQS